MLALDRPARLDRLNPPKLHDLLAQMHELLFFLFFSSSESVSESLNLGSVYPDFLVLEYPLSEVDGRVCEPLSRTELWQQPPRSQSTLQLRCPPTGLANGALPRGRQPPSSACRGGMSSLWPGVHIVGCLRIPINSNVT